MCEAESQTILNSITSTPFLSYGLLSDIDYHCLDSPGVGGSCSFYATAWTSTAGNDDTTRSWRLSISGHQTQYIVSKSEVQDLFQRWVEPICGSKLAEGGGQASLHSYWDFILPCGDYEKEKVIIHSPESQEAEASKHRCLNNMSTQTNTRLVETFPSLALLYLEHLKLLFVQAHLRSSD